MNTLRRFPLTLVQRTLQYYTKRSPVIFTATTRQCRTLTTSPVWYQTELPQTNNVDLPNGQSTSHAFQAETRMLLDIVAKSLYSDNEVFIRELISNSSDALEKLKYQQLVKDSLAQDGKLEININTDKFANTFTIQDNGVGMTQEEMISNLGTIARSGSKAFLEEVQKSGQTASSIIGQFGVGFYSAFMVADKVQVFSRAASPDAKGYLWSSDGSGTFEISETEGAEIGSKIVLHLKHECSHFASEETIKGIVKKYSNFVGSPIYLNGQQINTIQALWLKNPKEVSAADHQQFYRFITGAFDDPRYSLHYHTDAPISLRCVLYVPESRPGMLELSRDFESGVSLYSRRVLIQPKADHLLPKWLRFVRGIVDSEDIPLNLSRELLQNNALIRKIRTVLTNRMLRYFYSEITSNPQKYDAFFSEYGVFFKEGILSSHEQLEKEEIAKILRFESSSLPEGTKTTLAEYAGRMKEGQKDIYYLAAPSRTLVETSPYFEGLKSKDVELLYCYETYDELVLLQLQQFDRKNLVSAEKEMRRDTSEPTSEKAAEEIPTDQSQALLTWLQTTLDNKVHKVKVTKLLSQHPCLVSVEEMGAARHFVRTAVQDLDDNKRYKILEPTLELNLSHPIIQKLSVLRETNAGLATLLAHQLLDNAMVAAGLVDDPRKVTTRLNDLLTSLLEKH